jgi:TonB-linked SusC/RagA family outer membrane protein
LATVGFNQQSFNRLNYNSRALDIITESVPAQALTTGENFIGQDEFDWAIRGGFYRLKYIFDDKYLFTFNGRYDLSSRFLKENNSVFTPSASVGWRLSNEKFMDFSNDWLNNLMIRDIYGVIGNEAISRGGTQLYYPFKPALPFTKSLGYIFDGDVNPAAITGVPTLVSPSLTWETVTTQGIGLDFSAFNNRLSGSFDYYERIAEDIIVPEGARPSILGIGSPDGNNADTKTKGYEVSLSWKDRIGNDFSYGVGLNFCDSRACYTRFKGNPNNRINEIYVGREVGELWGLTTEGFFTTQAEADEAKTGGNHDQSFISGSGRGWKPGDIKYRDLNGDGKIDNGTNTKGDSGDYSIIGNTRARYNYGINLDLGYKGWSLSAFFQGVGKRDINPGGDVEFWPYRDSFDNIQEHQLDTWTPDNPNAYYPQLEAGATRNYQTQTRYLQDGAFLRLRNLSLVYNLSQKALDKLPISGLTLSLVGTNVWETHNLRKPYDPDGNDDGLQDPYRRSYSLGVKVQF